MTKKINTKERRDKIKDIIEKEEEVRVPQLADFFGTSQATIRTDLKEMERAKLLQRTHGGAISIGSAYKSYYDTTLKERMNINKEEKQKIAQAGANLVQDGDTIIIDSGTTSIYLARELSQKKNLTIVTNAVLVAQELFYNPSIKVILLGGNVEPGNQFTYGNDTVTQLQKYRANKYLMSIDGISVEHGLTTYHHQELELSRLMIERSNEVIIVADHSKIGKEGFSNITDISCVDVIITDKYDSSKPELEAIREKGIVVIEV